MYGGAISKTSTHLKTNLLPIAAFSLSSPLSHGKPCGKSLERTGRGPILLDHTARDHVEHGGDMMMASKSPCFILFAISSHFSSSFKSWPSPKMRSTSTISNSTPLAMQSCWIQLRTSLLRGAPEKRYSTLKRLLGLGDTCIGETDLTFSQSPAPAFGVAALLVSLPPDLHDDLG